MDSDHHALSSLQLGSLRGAAATAREVPAATKPRARPAAGGYARRDAAVARALPQALGDLLERAAVQLDSEVNEARNYAQRRDDEVYKLSVVRATLYGGIRHVI